MDIFNEFKEFKSRLKFKPRVKYGWSFKTFKDLSWRSIETGFWGNLDAAA